MADCIGREALVQHLKYVANHHLHSDILTNRIVGAAFMNLSEMVERLPAANVKPVVRGEWIPETDRHYHWHCSECGYVIGTMRMDANFCLKCGADMRGKSNAKMD